MWSPYQSLCHTPVLSATAKNTKPFFSLPGALLIRHRWSLITLRSQIFIASVGPPVAGNSLHCFFTCPSSQKATEISFFSPVEDREEHLLYWRRTSYPPPCCSIAQLCLTVTPWTAAHQASLSFTISWNSSLGKLQTIFFFSVLWSLFSRPDHGQNNNNNNKKNNLVKTCLFSPRHLTFDSFLPNRKKPSLTH